MLASAGPKGRPAPGTGLKWVIWGVALSAYLIAIINRSSFSALGTVAQEHFGAEATTLSMLVVLQLMVYALCQIPVGIALDRFGTARVIFTGAVVMAAGQLLLGSTDLVGLAIFARILGGMGDACIFTSVIRLVAEWFTFRQIPVVNQLTGLAGQTGQLLAVAPLAAAVAAFGWTAGFAGLAAAGTVTAVLVFCLLRDAPGASTLLERLTRRGPGHDAASAPPSAGSAPDGPGGGPGEGPVSLVTDALPVIGPNSSGIFPAISSLLKRPGVRLAFWVHFTTPFTLLSFMLLWGTPFITGGLGYSFAAAAAALSAAVIASMAGALFIGPLVARFSAQRVWLAAGGATIIAGLWAGILLWPGQPPFGLLLIAAVAMGLGGPLSMIAFDVVRTHAPRRQLGVATGMTNMGGFIAALSCILLIGVVLDLQGAGTPENYSMGAFKGAMAVQLPILALGVTMMLIERHRAAREHRRRMRRAGQ